LPTVALARAARKGRRYIHRFDIPFFSTTFLKEPKDETLSYFRITTLLLVSRGLWWLVRAHDRWLER
jgi:hypothetical protein